MPDPVGEGDVNLPPTQRLKVLLASQRTFATFWRTRARNIGDLACGVGCAASGGLMGCAENEVDPTQCAVGPCPASAHLPDC